MDDQDRQHVWREIRAQCEAIGHCASLREENMPTAEGLRAVVVELLETLEQILHNDLARDEDAEALDPESVEGIVNTLHEQAAARRDVARDLTEAEQAEDRASEICEGIMTRMFDVRRRQS